MHLQLLLFPAHATVVALHRTFHLCAGDRQQLVFQPRPQLFHIQVALFGGEAGQVRGVPFHRVLGIERQDGVDDVVRIGAGIEIPALGRGFQWQVIDREVDLALDLVDIGVVQGALVLLAAHGVLPGLDLTLAGHGRADIAVDDHVGQEHAHHVFRGELVLECLQREHAALVDELADARDRIVLPDMEGQHCIGHRAIGDLLVDAEHMAAPVAARRHRTLGIDRDFSAAPGAFERHQCRGVGVDVTCARGNDRTAQLVDGLAQAELFLDACAMPFVTAVQADQDVGAGLGPDVGGTALRAAVEAVLQLAGRRIDGHRVGRFHFITDGLWQFRGVQREAAGQGRDVLRRTGPIQRRRRQGRRRRGRGSGQRRRAVSGIGHVRCASCCYRPSALAFRAS